ncbi:type IV secretory system conjugative DNA transfer family protein [Streptomyces sp. NPDC060366]|uniref:type IV secretory system conjugative DNA transfer family protein n=1 Tax=Streptomyces sp. NPDC060366 TaxID=3347105 RepID=UPI00365E1A85
MSTPATTTPRAASTERAIAWATTLAPITTGILAPLLDGGAAFTAVLAYGGAAGFMTTNHMNRLPAALAANLPAGDILKAHESPLFISTLTTGMALGMGTLTGPEGADTLMAGALTLPSIPGIFSLGWWAAVALVPWKLRLVLRRPRKAKPQAGTPAQDGTVAPPATAADHILQRWGQHISDPQSGAHRNQILTLRTLGPTRWTGTITAPTGASVNVTAGTVSSVYQIPTAWITFTPGAHEGERHITVNLTAPAELDTNTLAGAWRKWAARSGGIMAGTHLEDVQPDPNTGGEVARVVANENVDSLPTPDMRDLVGALRTSHLLLSYEPSTNPRKAKVRIMKENPLQAGIPFPGPQALLPSEGGYFRLGRAVSGRPIRAQLLDPKLGARHILISGITGSGKGGVLQLIALAAHLAGAVIIYADPKGSSNPAIEQMAAYTGLGEDGAMGALLLMEALVDHRIDLTGQLKLKNFDPTVMPHVVFILDEASTLLGEKAQHLKRATRAVAHIAKKGRSLGASEVLANQLLQLAEIGGDSAIRDNIVGSGGSIMLRSDSSQRHLIDLPPGMESVNPADIPATWTGDDSDTLVYTDDVHIEDPESTFGLGYFMTTDGVCAMGRTYDLEDATAYINPDRIAEPTDWPEWDDRHALVAALLADGEGEDGDSDGSDMFFSAPTSTPKKSTSTEDKILRVLAEVTDPLGYEVMYRSKTDIGNLTGAEGSTFSNALSRLTQTGKIHRQIKDGREVPGMYGLGPAPEAE